MILPIHIILAMTTVALPFHNSPAFPTSLVVWMTASVLVCGAVTVMLFAMGQGGSRLPIRGGTAEPEASDTNVGDGTPDACWYLGAFYYNPDDPAVWVEKRLGVGYTMNMARYQSWLALGAILLVAAGGSGLSIFLAMQVANDSRPGVHPAFEAAPAAVHQDFESDPALIGNWQTVDFVEHIEDFDPHQPTKPKGGITEITVRPEGKFDELTWRWTQGKVCTMWKGTEYCADYAIKSIEDRTYLFLPWISGDVTIHGQAPHYYVLIRTSGDSAQETEHVEP